MNNDSIRVMGQLIIHADDFGLTEKVNAGILKAHLEGILTSTSIMATGSAFSEAIKMCQKVPSLDTGVHLTLVGEKSILSQDVIRSLVNKEGMFHAHATQFVQNYYCGRISLDEVYRELEAQICKVLNTGIAISHLDSHQHLHMLPRILSITVELAKKYRIAAIRFPSEKFSCTMLRELSQLPRIAQLLVLNTFCYLGRNMEALRTDRFFGFLYGGNLTKDNLSKIIETFPQKGTWELMCHPGMEDSESSYGIWGYHWQEELDALLDSDITNILNRKGISLISYRDLAQGQPTPQIR